jgi:hypothetical protein
MKPAPDCRTRDLARCGQDFKQILPLKYRYDIYMGFPTQVFALSEALYLS